MAKFFDVCTKKTYRTNAGEEKTRWLKAGTLQVNDGGNQFIQLNHLPDVTFYVFEQKKKGE